MLVALSCVVVLGFAMIAFLAVSNPAMRLSNRAYAKAVSKNLAEMGIDRALRSFNAGNFASSGWTVNATSGIANLTLAIPSSRYGTSGITASVNIRVDRYRDTRKALPWNDRTAYATNDFVWYQGIWYLCTTTPTIFDTTNASYWTAVAAWNSATAYTEGTYVVLGGTVYCCHRSHSNQNPSTSPTYWSRYSPLAWNSATSYLVGTDVVVGGTTFYSCIAANTNRSPASNPSSWSVNTLPIWDSARVYVVGDVVYSGGTFYRRILAQGPWDTANWKAAPDNWSPYANYRVGNIVLSGGSAYRCVAPNINQAPPNASFWTAVTVAAWNATTTYSVDDVVWSGGLPYRCLTGHANLVPPNSANWLSAPAIYAEGVARLPEGGGTDIKSQMRALISPAPLFPNALGATNDIVLGSSGTIDSYNSVLGTYGQTSAPFSAGSPNTGSSAVVAGGDTASTAVAIGDMRIRGYVAAPSASTSPFAPLTSNSTNGIVTSTASGTPATKIDLTRLSRSPYIPQFDILSVTGAGVLPNGTTVLDDNQTTLGVPGVTTPTRYNITGTRQSGSWTSGLSLEDSTDILTIAGPVILNVSGTLYTNSGKIVILPGGSLEIYFNNQLWIGRNDANTGVHNLTLDPKKCLLVGTSNSNSPGSHYYWTTNAYSFVSIYMPSAYVRTWSSVVYYGAISASNIGFPNAGVAFRYDTSLRTAGAIGTFIDRPYITSEVRELVDATERITLP